MRNAFRQCVLLPLQFQTMLTAMTSRLSLQIRTSSSEMTLREQRCQKKSIQARKINTKNGTSVSDLATKSRVSNHLSVAFSFSLARSTPECSPELGLRNLEYEDSRRIHISCI
ncbi:hypothetical protein BDV97DRAFT_358657, partial [Delphinella strobiligena]